MSEKIETDKKKGIRSCLPALLKALKAGVAAEELRDKKGCKHDTLHVLLAILKDAGLIDERGRKWYYTWDLKQEDLRKELQEYQSEAEFERHLRHSQDLVGGAARMEEGDVKMDIYDLVLGERSSLFREHIESGYPTLFSALKSVDELDKRMEAVFTQLYEALEEVAISLGYEIKESAKLWSEVQSRKLSLGPEIRNLKNALGSYEAEMARIYDPTTNTWETLPLTCYPRAYKKPGSDSIIYTKDQGEPRDFIVECKNSEPVKSRHSVFVEKVNDSQNAYTKLSIVLEPVLRKIFLEEESLNGHCRECPKVLIKRDS